MGFALAHLSLSNSNPEPLLLALDLAASCCALVL